MAQPITNLTANWSAGVGIQLNWTAAGDVSTGSSYEIYYLNNNSTFVATGTLYAISVKPTGSSSYSLIPPTNTFLFSWQTMLTLGSSVNPPTNVTLQVVHIDSSGAYSTPVSILVVQPNNYTYDGIPHLDNNFVVNTTTQGFATTSQNSGDEISNCVAIVLGTRPNQRSLVPYFGIEDLPINKINTPDITQVVKSWEPRAQIQISNYYDQNNQAQINVKVIGTPGANL